MKIRKYMQLLGGTIALSLLIAACAPSQQVVESEIENNNEVIVENNDQVTATDEQKQEEVVDEEANNSDESQLWLDFMNMVKQGTSASTLAAYIDSNISSASILEADGMIQWLLIFQTSAIQDGNNRVYTEEYINALNYDMDGTLNPDLIPKIQDDAIASFYQNLYDAHLTIVRYEETPVVETNWDALTSYLDYVSEDLAYIIQENVDYRYGFLDGYGDYAQVIASLEKRLDHLENNFVASLMRNLHSTMISNLLIGPEGTFMNTFVDKSESYYTGDLYDALVAFAHENDSSDFAKLILKLDTTEWTSYEEPTAIISSYYPFGYGIPFQWISETGDAGNNYNTWMTLTSDVYPEVAEKVNTSLNLALMSMVNDLNLPEDYSLSMYQNYSSEKYASVSVYISYNDINGNYIFHNEAYTFSLEDGSELSLADYLHVSQDDLLDTIRDMTGETFTLIPNYYLGYNGNLILIGSDLEPGLKNVFLEVTPKILINYISVDELY